MPFPYARLIVGTRHCRVLISGNLNFYATGIDINPHYKPLPRAVRNAGFKILGGKIWRSQLTAATPHTANRNQHL